MSMDLIAWKAPTVESEEEAAALVDRFDKQGDESQFEPSEDVAKFYEEVMARFPPQDRDCPPDEDPWVSAPQLSKRVVVMNIRWSTSGETLDAIVELARKH